MSSTHSLLQRTRLLTRLVQSQDGTNLRFNDLVEALSTTLDAKVAIISRKGKVLAVTEGIGYSAGMHVEEATNRQFLALSETTSVTDMALKGENNGQAVTLMIAALVVLPLHCAGERLGTLIVNHALDEADLVLAEYATAVVSMVLLRAKQMELMEENRRQVTAHTAVTSLSFSEMEVLAQVFNDLAGTEGLVVASKIADRAGITRSVIVNGLRKLESAGVITSRSLGMKGTYIKVLNPLFLEELKLA